MDLVKKFDPPYCAFIIQFLSLSIWISLMLKLVFYINGFNMYKNIVGPMNDLWWTHEHEYVRFNVVALRILFRVWKVKFHQFHTLKMWNFSLVIRTEWGSQSNALQPSQKIVPSFIVSNPLVMLLNIFNIASLYYVLS